MGDGPRPNDVANLARCDAVDIVWHAPSIPAAPAETGEPG